MTSQYRSPWNMSLKRSVVILPTWNARYFSLNSGPHGAISPLPDICNANGGPKQREYCRMPWCLSLFHLTTMRSLVRQRLAFVQDVVNGRIALVVHVQHAVRIDRAVLDDRVMHAQVFGEPCEGQDRKSTRL